MTAPTSDVQVHKTESEPYPLDALKELREEGYLAYERGTLLHPVPGVSTGFPTLDQGLGVGDWVPDQVVEMISNPWAEPRDGEMKFLIKCRALPKGRETDPKAEGIATSIRDVPCSWLKPIPRKRIFSK
jgi:hypothetical protein